MRFTEHEMVFFNSITKGDTVFGIPLKFLEKNGHGEEVNRTIRGLIEKGVLNSETELSKQGGLTARALECYKESKIHIIINHLHIAPLEDKEAILIIPLKNREYEMLRLPRIALLYVLLDKYPILRDVAKPVEINTELLEINDFLKELKQHEEHIMTGEFQEGTVVRELVYFWKKEIIYQYNLNNQRQKTISTVELRKELLKLLRIHEEVENYGQ